MAMFLLLSLFLQPAFASYSSLINPIYFNFNFEAKNCDPHGSLICSGGVTSDGFLDLNPDFNDLGSLTTGSVGRVLYTLPVIAWPAWFMTTFTVAISNEANATDVGDGMAFLMVSDCGPGPTNSYGGFLGLFNHSTGGNTTNQVAIELDTFMNEWDPNDNHIGIDTKTITSDATSADLRSFGINLKSGKEVIVTIFYFGQNNTLLIYMGYVGSPLTLVLDYAIDLPNTARGPVYVGFTGSIAGRSREKHQIINWSFSSIPLADLPYMKGAKDIQLNKVSIIGIAVGGGAAVIAMILFPITIRRVCKHKHESKVSRNDIESRSRSAVNGPKSYTFKQLSKATKNFSKDNILGAGGFGIVYRGELLNPPNIVAVKRITATSSEGEKEFLAEICTIGRLKHKNIVQLQGWCHERGHLLLVYEFMPNGSLDQFISKAFLNWPARYSILTGLASALLYLHEESGQHVVHRDVKPNNIMLDADFNTHLGDFGLARLLDNQNSVLTRMAGTPGYLAPECNYTCKATFESDVFSFGIVVLEVVCGRRSWGSGLGESNLVDSAWGLHGKGELLQGVDPKLEGKYNEEEVKRALVVGLACAHPDPILRPAIRKVVHVFTNPNEPLMELPESRPSAIYVPVSSTPGSGSASANSSHLIHTSLDETILDCGR